MALRVHVTIPFDRVASELSLPMRGVIPAGAFTVRRPQPAEGWDAAGLPVPDISARRARLLYNRGVIAPVQRAAEEFTGTGRHDEPKSRRKNRG